MSVGIFFCRLSLGGPLIGIICGVIVSLWLSRIVNNPILEVNLTVFSAYILFYIAESELKVSGILAMVAFGLWMTRSGKTRISSASEHAVHYVWSYIGFIAETVIFLLTGVIVAIKVLKEDSVIGPSDYWKLLILYAFLHCIRFVIVYSTGWFVSLIGYTLDQRQMGVLSYGGLRGAVGLSLALIVKLDHELHTDIQDIVLFHTSGIALLTLLFNGTTTGFLVKQLGMMRISNVKKKMMRNFLRIFKETVEECCTEMQRDTKSHFNHVRWDEVKKIAGINEIEKTLYQKHEIALMRS